MFHAPTLHAHNAPTPPSFTPQKRLSKEPLTCYGQGELMKRIATLLLLALGVGSATAQNYSIDWFKVAGGGGTSTGGVYAVSGTIGQPDAGTMSGGTYTLTGGFWSILAAIQTPGAPLLRVLLTSTNTVLVAWPAPSTGFSLQHNTALGTANWLGVTNVPNVVGTENQVIISPPSGNNFFRLKQ